MLRQVQDGTFRRRRDAVGAAQPIRDGDYGGAASTDLSTDEAYAVVDAGEFARSRRPPDNDETDLVMRLRSLLD